MMDKNVGGLIGIDYGVGKIRLQFTGIRDIEPDSVAKIHETKPVSEV